MKKYLIITCLTSLTAARVFADAGAAKQLDGGSGAAINESSGAGSKQGQSSGAPSPSQENQSDVSRVVVEPSGARSEVGEIVVEGSVRTVQQREAIEKHLKAMPGVSKVDNRITVVGDLRQRSRQQQTEEQAIKGGTAPQPEDSSSQQDENPSPTP